MLQKQWITKHIAHNNDGIAFEEKLCSKFTQLLHKELSKFTRLLTRYYKEN